MKYRKLGLIFCPSGNDPLQRAYAILPTPIMTRDGLLRIFFASTDDRTIGRVFYADLDPLDPLRVLSFSKGPALCPGSAGRFDEFGVNPASIVEDQSRLLLYYVGYSRPGGDIPYTLFTGLAVSSNDGVQFERTSDAPVLPKIANERYFRTAAYVSRTGPIWRMWYIGGGRFIDEDGKKLPVYGLRYSESANGVHWNPPRQLLNPNLSAGQIGFGRPYVAKAGPRLRMFLSIRTRQGYSISHAYSNDGIAWDAWEHDVIPRSPDGWDSEMCCYAACSVLNGREYVFYNGNAFGRTGFGVAVRED